MRQAFAALLLAVALLTAVSAQAGPPLTTLCVGLPECGGPPAPGPDPLAPANQALQREEYARALPLLATLAEAGNAEAQYKLGDLHFKGQGTAQDYPAAARWYARAAEALDTEWATEAQYNLGQMFELGQGVERDPVQGLVWFEVAVALGSYLAVETRALVAQRLGPQDAARAKERAARWLAERGMPVL
jgi:uncharacterized protein